MICSMSVLIALTSLFLRFPLSIISHTLASMEFISQRLNMRPVHYREIGFSPLDINKGRANTSCIGEYCSGEIHRNKPRSAKISPSQMCPFQICSFQMCFLQISSFQMCSEEISLL